MILTTCLLQMVLIMADAKELALWQNEPASTMPAERVEEHASADGSRNRTYIGSTHATLTLYESDQPNANHPAILICPGGGYQNLAIDKEGHNVAKRFAKNGVTAIVLKYRMPNGVAPANDAMPTPVLDVREAIRVVRSHAKEWNIDPARVGIMGFSAGGHLAGMAATQFDSPDDRPAFAMLIYPVASLRDEFMHRGSRDALIGPSPSAELIARFSVDEHVTKQTPPLFLVHAKDDRAVPIANSERIDAAAKNAGVSCELTEYEKGGHGFGMGVDGGDAKAWFDKGIDWLKSQGFVAK